MEAPENALSLSLSLHVVFSVSREWPSRAVGHPACHVFHTENKKWRSVDDVSFFLATRSPIVWGTSDEELNVGHFSVCFLLLVVFFVLPNIGGPLLRSGGGHHLHFRAVQLKGRKQGEEQKRFVGGDTAVDCRTTCCSIRPKNQKKKIRDR